MGGGANVPRLCMWRLERNPVSRNPWVPQEEHLLLNRADQLSATWPSPPAEQGRAKSQFFHSRIRTQGTKPGNHSSPAGNLVLLKIRFGKCPGSAALV